MKRLAIPSAFHEVLGETQELSALAGLGLTVLFLGGAIGWAALPSLSAVEGWRAALALLLILDIIAGCAANFTRGTNDFYAARPVHRIGFIAVHVHLPVVLALTGLPLVPGLLVWAWTIAGAFVINALDGRSSQVPVAGVLLVVGLGAAPLVGPWEPWALAVAQLFLVKVLYAFAVNHYPTHRSQG
ncbi:hypothetical protein [Silanimonas sp.]|jgi:hypothetical protein|uniref:hypothetical protein n=1 Tax=Silanimonas sp. TaxID=1929290 RepID=UPI0022BC6247|nr:hypothetical protein [Silanimonas sp.]MCZ8061634.1 hypothetical protein [Silanimonas sp.]